MPRGARIGLSDGTAVPWTAWSPGEPSNADPSKVYWGTGEDIVVMAFQNGAVVLWNDRSVFLPASRSSKPTASAILTTTRS